MDTNQRIKETVEGARVMLFMKGNRDFPQCGFSGRAVQILQVLGTEFETADVLADDEAPIHRINLEGETRYKSVLGGFCTFTLCVVFILVLLNES